VTALCVRSPWFGNQTRHWSFFSEMLFFWRVSLSTCVKGAVSFTPRTTVAGRPMLRQIVIDAETPGDSRTMFRLRMDASIIADGLTAAQAHVLVAKSSNELPCRSRLIRPPIRLSPSNRRPPLLYPAAGLVGEASPSAMRLFTRLATRAKGDLNRPAAIVPLQKRSTTLRLAAG